MDKRDVRRIVSAAKGVAEVTVKKAKAQGAMAPSQLDFLDGLQPVDASFGPTSPNLLNNGGFENTKVLTINPSPWLFQDCTGFVMDYRYQATNSDSIYTSSSGNTGKPSTQSATEMSELHITADAPHNVVESAFYLIQAYTSGGVTFTTKPFHGATVDALAESKKFLLVQPSTGHDTFDVSAPIPQGVLVAGRIYRLDLAACAYLGSVPDRFITIDGNGKPVFQFDAECLTADNKPSLISRFFYLDSEDIDPTVSVQVEIDFLDSDGQVVATYDADEMACPHGMVWSENSLMFRAPEETVSATLRLCFQTSDAEEPHSVLLDNIRVYAVGPSHMLVDGDELPKVIQDQNVRIEELGTSPSQPAQDTLAPKPPTSFTGTATDDTLPGQAPSQKVTLNWVAPTHNTNDSTLTDLLGYRVEVYDGAAWSSAAGLITAPASSFTFSGLPVESRQYRIYAVDTSNNCSAPASTTVDAASIQAAPIPVNVDLDGLGMAGVVEVTASAMSHPSLAGVEVQYLASDNDYTATGTPSFSSWPTPSADNTIFFTIATGQALTQQFSPSQIGKWYKVRVRSVIYGGARSDWSADSPAASSLDSSSVIYPPELPAGVTASTGVGIIMLRWGKPNHDFGYWQVHQGTSSTFTPGPGNLVCSPLSNWAIVRGTAGTSAYFKVRAVSWSGDATDYVLAGPYTFDKATSAELGDDSVGPQHIADLAVGQAHIADLAVSTGKIQDLAVTNAKIFSLAVDKLTTGTLAASTSITVGSGNNKVTITSGGIRGYWGAASPYFSLDVNNGLTIKESSIDLTGSVERAFIQVQGSGIGAGAVRLDQNGLRCFPAALSGAPGVTVDSSGITLAGSNTSMRCLNSSNVAVATFGAEGMLVTTSGAGLIVRDGSLDLVRVNNTGLSVLNSQGTTVVKLGKLSDYDYGLEMIGGRITGAVFETAAFGQRIEVNSVTNRNKILFYSGSQYEGNPGTMVVDATPTYIPNTTTPFISLTTPRMVNYYPTTLTMYGQNSVGSYEGHAVFTMYNVNEQPIQFFIGPNENGSIWLEKRGETAVYIGSSEVGVYDVGDDRFGTLKTGNIHLKAGSSSEILMKTYNYNGYHTMAVRWWDDSGWGRLEAGRIKANDTIVATDLISLFFGTGSGALRGHNSTHGVVVVRSDGSEYAKIVASAFETSSLRSTKQNIRPLDSGLDELLGLKVRRFQLKSEPDDEMYGFILDELPESLLRGESYDIVSVVALTVKAVQELYGLVKGES